MIVVYVEKFSKENFTFRIHSSFRVREYSIQTHTHTHTKKIKKNKTKTQGFFQLNNLTIFSSSSSYINVTHNIEHIGPGKQHILNNHRSSNLSLGRSMVHKRVGNSISIRGPEHIFLSTGAR